MGSATLYENTPPNYCGDCNPKRIKNIDEKLDENQQHVYLYFMDELTMGKSCDVCGKKINMFSKKYEITDLIKHKIKPPKKMIEAKVGSPLCCNSCMSQISDGLDDAGVWFYGGVERMKKGFFEEALYCFDKSLSEKPSQEVTMYKEYALKRLNEFE